MMKKRLFILSSVMLLLLGMIAGFTACAGNDTTDTDTSVDDSESDSLTDTETDEPSDTSSDSDTDTETETETETEWETESETYAEYIGKIQDPTHLSGFYSGHNINLARSGCDGVIDEYGVLRLSANWEAPDAQGQAENVDAKLTVKYTQLLAKDGFSDPEAHPNGSDYTEAKRRVMVFKVKAREVLPDQFYLQYVTGTDNFVQRSETMTFPVVAPTGTGKTEYIVFDLTDREDFAASWLYSFSLTWRNDISTAQNINSYLHIYEIALLTDMEEAEAYIGQDIPAEVEPGKAPTVTPPADNTPDTEDLGAIIPQNPTDAWTPTVEYPGALDDSLLRSYADKTATDFDKVYRYYRQQGYKVYYKAEKDGNRFATVTREAEMVHIYWYKNLGELNVVTSATAADTLPPKTPAATTGSYQTTVTQLNQAEYVNGMGYVVQLADGSFIIFDGGYPGQCERLYKFMKNSLPEGAPIIIRAWVLTHSHSDHYSAFHWFADRYADKVTVEHIIVSPVSVEKTLETYRVDTVYFANGQLTERVAKFEGAKLTIAHPGMEFTFCNLALEILFAAEDTFKADQPPTSCNESSTVSRLYGDGFSFMVVGDAAGATANFLRSVYSDEYLHSDIMQAAHHGGNGLPLDFYMAVKPTVIMYPCAFTHYRDYDDKAMRQALLEEDFLKLVCIGGVEQYTLTWGENVPEGTAKLPVHVWD